MTRTITDAETGAAGGVARQDREVGRPTGLVARGVGRTETRSVWSRVSRSAEYPAVVDVVSVAVEADRRDPEVGDPGPLERRREARAGLDLRRPEAAMGDQEEVAVVGRSWMAAERADRDRVADEVAGIVRAGRCHDLEAVADTDCRNSGSHTPAAAVLRPAPIGVSGEDLIVARARADADRRLEGPVGTRVHRDRRQRRLPLVVLVDRAGALRDEVVAGPDLPAHSRDPGDPETDGGVGSGLAGRIDVVVQRVGALHLGEVDRMHGPGHAERRPVDAGIGRDE